MIDNETKDNTVRFRIAPDQLALLERRASWLGESVGQYVKRRILTQLEEDQKGLDAEDERNALIQARRAGSDSFARVSGLHDDYVQVYAARKRPTGTRS